MPSMVSRSTARLLPLVLAASLSACWGGGSQPAPQQAMVSHFVLGSPDLIQTTIIDPLPVKAAILKLPDGQTVAALQIDKERNVYHDQTGYGPNFDVGVSGGSQSRVSTGIGIGFPLFGDWGGPTPVRTSSMTTSTLRFQVPDMAAYRRDWQRWILHVDLDDGANRRSIETLPPAPPLE